MKENSIQTKCGEMYYQIVGSGKPVILLHGFGEDGMVWKHQLEYLKDHFKLFVPDLPGSGNSKLDAAASPTIADFAEGIDRLATNEDLKEFTLIGHSMGGYLALAFASLKPHILSGLGLFHSTAFADNDEKRAMREKSIDFIQKHGAFAFMEQSIPNLFGDKFKGSHSQEISQLVEAAKRFNNESLIVYYKAMMARPDRTVVLKTFLKPLLFIMGEKDKTVNLQDTLIQSHQPWQSHVYILKNSAHMGMWEEREKSNLVLLSYLRHVNEN